MIYNLNEEVVRVLHSLPGIELVATEFPNDWTAFPSAIYSATHTPVYVDANQVEQLTEWTVTIQLYGDAGSLTNLTEELRQAMGYRGFFGSTRYANVAGLKRTVCTFTATIDNGSRRVYHK